MAFKSTYTLEAGAAICAGLAEGRSLLAVCEDEGIGYGAARNWERDIAEHATNAVRAREIGCHALAEQALRISDTPCVGRVTTTKADGSVETREEDMTAHRRLQIDTRKWLIAKWLPKIYGDKVTHAGDPDAPLIPARPLAELTTEEIRAALAALVKPNAR